MKLFAMTMAALAGALSLAAGAHAAQPEDRQARVWAASCAACHGTSGKAVADGIPSIQGTSKEVILQKLLAFRQGTLPATVMHQHAKGYTEAELERIAAYFSRQSR